MDIWLPEPLYRMFPAFNISLGGCFLLLSSSKLSLILALALLGYGAAMFVARCRY